jgi:hypothetical protein
MSEPICLDAINTRGVGVRVAFGRTGDRFSHALYGIRRSDIVEVARSVDQEDFEGWPLSPPVQELREVPDDSGRPMLLLLGSAAYGHWSATVRTTGLDQGNPYLEFDIAVRLHRSPAYIGVAYESLEGTTWTGMPGGLAFAHTASRTPLSSQRLCSRLKQSRARLPICLKALRRPASRIVAYSFPQRRCQRGILSPFDGSTALLQPLHSAR